MFRCSLRLFLNLILFAFTAAVVQAVLLQCGGNPYPFGILPEGNKYLSYGDTLRLYCMLNTSHEDAKDHSSKDLYFYIMRGENRILTNSSVLNETTISTDIEDLPFGHRYVYCSLKKGNDEDISCMKYVEVGYKPEKVTNFSCVSYNWKKLVCSWFPKKTGITDTEYIVMYTQTNNINKAESSSKMIYSFCKMVENGSENTCEIESNYRHGYEYFIFNITGKNSLGSSSNRIIFHHYAHVIPDKPDKIRIVNQTIGSALITWSIPLQLNHFPPGIRTKIKFRSTWDPPDQWVERMVNEVADNFTRRMYNITGLKYAYTYYDVRIYLRSGAAVNDSYWSEPNTIVFQTLPTIPGKAPKTTFGSYHLTFRDNGKSDVFVYWNRIPESMMNGEDFSYNVTCVMNKKYDCDPMIEKTLTYAKYTINNNNEYVFTIYSVNKVGRSLDSSQVTVPKLSSIPRPDSLTSVPNGNGVYELSWIPVDHKDLNNYTIFWCEDDQNDPLPCKGTIDWIHVGKNVTVTNVTVKSPQKFYKFAIAANLKDGTSSGMFWLSCWLHDKEDKTVNYVMYKNVRPRKVDIVWQIECAQSSSFGGYYVYYCPLLSTQTSNCQENQIEERVLVKNFGKRNITLTNLKPYTTYRVQISIMLYNGTQQKIGPRSRPLNFTTSEDAPSEPLNLRKEAVTNSTITLMWDPPLETNGVLRNYLLHIGDRRIEVPGWDSNKLVTRYEVTKLKSYTWYNVTVAACTGDMKCSKSSLPIRVRTRAGIPGKMAWPRVINNNSVTTVVWEPPISAGGDLNYFELSVLSDGPREKIYNFTGTQEDIPLTNCNAMFRIRAINIDGDIVLKGPWSNQMPSPCHGAAWTKSVVFFVSLACFFFMASALLFYIGKRGWLHCRKMKDVEVKLPPGLQSQDLEKDNQDYLHLDIWPPRPGDAVQGSLGPGLAPDEVSLLKEKSDECLDHPTPFNINEKNGGYSSGCSMGRESVSSSIGSDNRASSDSGAEADHGNIGVPFGDWDTIKTQPVTVGGPTKNHSHEVKGHLAEGPLNFSVSDWNAVDPTAPGYTRVGFTAGQSSDKTLPEKGYVTIGSIAPLSPPQKSDPETNYKSLQLDDFSLLYDQESPTHQVELDSQTNRPSCYVPLACLQEQLLDRSLMGAPLSSSRSLVEKSQNEMGKEEMEPLPHHSSTSEPEMNATVPRSNGPMPPYVTMLGNPAHTSNEEDDEEEDEEEEEEEEIETEAEELGKGTEREEREGNRENEEREKNGVRISPVLNVVGKKTVNGIDNALAERISKDNGSCSNYIPHHVFEKESLHTQ